MLSAYLIVIINYSFIFILQIRKLWYTASIYPQYPISKSSWFYSQNISIVASFYSHRPSFFFHAGPTWLPASGHLLVTSSFRWSPFSPWFILILSLPHIHPSIYLCHCICFATGVLCPNLILVFQNNCSSYPPAFPWLSSPWCHCARLHSVL